MEQGMSAGYDSSMKLLAQKARPIVPRPHGGKGLNRLRYGCAGDRASIAGTPRQAFSKFDADFDQVGDAPKTEAFLPGQCSPLDRRSRHR